MPSSCAGLAFVVSGTLQGVQDALFFLFPIVQAEWCVVGFCRRIQYVFPQFQWSDEVALCQQCGTFYYVFQLAQVAWPRIALECFACRRVKSGQVAFQFAVCLVEEEIGKEQDVFPAFFQVGPCVG